MRDSGAPSRPRASRTCAPRSLARNLLSLATSRVGAQACREPGGQILRWRMHCPCSKSSRGPAEEPEPPSRKRPSQTIAPYAMATSGGASRPTPTSPAPSSSTTTGRRKNSITRPEKLLDVLRDLAEPDVRRRRRRRRSTSAPMALRLSPYILSLIDWDEPVRGPAAPPVPAARLEHAARPSRASASTRWASATTPPCRAWCTATPTRCCSWRSTPARCTAASARAPTPSAPTTAASRRSASRSARPAGRRPSSTSRRTRPSKTW